MVLQYRVICHIMVPLGKVVRGLLRTDPRISPSNLPRLPILRGQFGIASTSIRR